MKTVTIKVSITETAANVSCKTRVLRSKFLPNPYDKSKYNKKSFEWVLDDLEADTAYNILFTFDTPGKVSIEIAGDMVEPAITESFESGAFSPGYLITTNK